MLNLLYHLTYNKPMTVCIGALAEDGKTIVAVADKMMSINVPMPYQYEHEGVQKIFDLNENIVAMYSGQTNLADELIKSAILKIQELKPESVEDTAEIVRIEYQNYRLNFIHEAVLQPRNLTIAEYIEKQRELNQEVVNGIEKALTEFDLGLEFIVCGLDKTGGHVYIINNPGICILNDGVGYACIGIGAPHALYSLIDSGYTKSLEKENVEQMVELAKQRSEHAPGVGKLTQKKVIFLKERKNAK